MSTTAMSEAAAAPQHPAPQHLASRSLWIGGLSAEVSDELLQSRLEDVRRRAATAHGSSAGWRDFGSFVVRRMQEASGAWVDFTSPALAHEVITVLNGSTIGPGAILARYSRQGELTTTAPSASRAVPNWMGRPPPSTAPSTAATADGGPEAASTVAAPASAPSPTPAPAAASAMPPPPPVLSAPAAANAPPPADEGRRKREAEGAVADEDARRHKRHREGGGGAGAGGGGAGGGGAGGAGGGAGGGGGGGGAGGGGRGGGGGAGGERRRGLLGAADTFDDEAGGEAEALRCDPLSRPRPAGWPGCQSRPGGQLAVRGGPELGAAWGVICR